MQDKWHVRDRKRTAPTLHGLSCTGLALAISLALTGCAVSPDFTAPAAPQTVVDTYTSGNMSATTVATSGGNIITAGAAQHIAYGQELPAQWWTLFHSDALDQLIKMALQRNPTLAAAQASLRQAKENYTADTGNLIYPNVTGQLGAERERAQLYGPTPSVYNLYNAGVNVSYTIDAFGASKRELEALAATVDYQRFQVEAAYQMLVSNVVTTAIREASLRAQLEATKAVLSAQQNQLAIVQKQLASGAISRSVELSQSSLVAQTETQIPPLEKALAQTRHQLAAFVGKLPSESGLPEIQLDSLQLPVELPVSVPSALVRQRPDIRASEALLHQASAELGVATANLYPQINLSGNFSLNRAQIGSQSASSTLWSLGAGLTQPLFNGGALSAKRRAAEAALDQASAQYRSTVLSAFQNVADNLRAIDSDATALKAQANAESIAKQSLDLNSKQYALGGVSYLTLLDAQRNYQQARVNLVAASAARLTDTASLFAALGGGWWKRGNEDSNSGHGS